MKMNLGKNAQRTHAEKVRKSVTRGYGALEGYLARRRVELANSKIPPGLRCGRILDVGCSDHPYFLLHTDFAERYGVDRTVGTESCRHYLGRGIELRSYDIESSGTLPFADRSFDVVTMLAVLEHIEPDRATIAIREVHRVLKTDGVFVLTTPPPWSDLLLRAMSVLRLVSSVEMMEHKKTYTPSSLAGLLDAAGFPKVRTKIGFFELFLNLWAVAEKA